MSRRRSFSATSAARSTSDRDAPTAMAESVPMEQGQITMPALSAEPDAGAAPRSPSSKQVTHRSHALAPTVARSASTESMSSSVCSSRSPWPDTISWTGRSADDERLEQTHGVRSARRAGDGDDDRARRHPLAPSSAYSPPVRWMSRSVSTQTKNAMLMTPFIVKNAASSREKSSAFTSECS